MRMSLRMVSLLMAVAFCVYSSDVYSSELKNLSPPDTGDMKKWACRYMGPAKMSDQWSWGAMSFKNAKPGILVEANCVDLINYVYSSTGQENFTIPDRVFFSVADIAQAEIIARFSKKQGYQVWVSSFLGWHLPGEDGLIYPVTVVQVTKGEDTPYVPLTAEVSRLIFLSNQPSYVSDVSESYDSWMVLIDPRVRKLLPVGRGPACNSPEIFLGIGPEAQEAIVRIFLEESYYTLPSIKIDQCIPGGYTLIQQTPE